MGGVLALSSILALSLMFASCANNSDSDDNGLGNPSPSLPANVGTNPIKNEIKLNHNDYAYFVMKTDGTAEYYDDDELEYVFKYTWDTTKKEIYMALEKNAYWNMGEKSQLLTYDQILSKIKEDYTAENMRNYNRTYYEEIKGKDWFKDEYPDCDTYEKFEKAFIEDRGCSSFEDFVKSCKKDDEINLKATFGALITFSYEVNENDKITLTEKFTGVKNLFDSRCEYGNYNDGKDIEARIYCSYANISEYDSKNRFEEYYYGYPNADKRTIDFEKVKDTWTEDWKHERVSLGNVKATYTEDISGKTVTIKCEGKEYVCEFKGQKFIQE